LIVAMLTRRSIGLIVGTAIVSIVATLLLRDILSEEAPIAGATPGQFRSAILGAQREYLVHLPESYATDTTARYPVLYVLDGGSQSGHTASSAELLSRVGLIPEVIVVGVPSVDGDTRNRDYTPPDMRLDTDRPGGLHGEADRFLNSLRSELLPLIERTYRTTRPRMLAGWSRGGLFVVYSELTAPALFDARFAYSPALWRENDLIVEQADRALASDSLVRGFLYLSLGDAENAKMKASFEHLRDVLRRHPGPTLQWTTDLSRGGTHETNPRLSTPVGLCLFWSASTGRSCRPNGAASASH
jgi:predicted alpha/beta superfamily hydrolase